MRPICSSTATPMLVCLRSAGSRALQRRRLRRHPLLRRRPLPALVVRLSASPPALKRIMAMSSKLLALTLPAIALLASCDTVNTKTGAMANGLGEAVKYDNAIQTINPEPTYAQGGAQPGGNGEVGADAVKA